MQNKQASDEKGVTGLDGIQGYTQDVWFTRFLKKGLQSKSATVSLNKMFEFDNGNNKITDWQDPPQKEGKGTR